ncbi:NADH-quinone oxidoreductase subunit NuoI [Candidatus Zinderia endosymbiont of Aphrophora alni]|uniref:NADH-quinone oxidoreductase subunit NuoI n=1 Tax=Candidatus Zinderia endosymbiont of Aphrophora alni TaxID=3077951 RepID=UPI0030D4F13A
MLYIKKKIKNFFLVKFIKSFLLTIKYFFSKKITIYYPEEKTPISPRFRGLHALRRYPNGEERCIACKLCEAICPAMAINIKIKEDKNGSRKTKKYNIDLKKCIFCGFCEEACPVDSIVQTHIFKFNGNNKKNLFLTKKMLLKNGDKYEKKIMKARIADSKYI